MPHLAAPDQTAISSALHGAVPACTKCEFDAADNRRLRGGHKPSTWPKKVRLLVGRGSIRSDYCRGRSYMEAEGGFSGVPEGVLKAGELALFDPRPPGAADPDTSPLFHEESIAAGLI